MDWLDKTREDRFVFELVDPFDLDENRGYLDNVIEGSCSLTEGYYTDTLVSGTLKAAEHNYVDYSLIRIHHYVDEESYHNELGTFFVSSRSKSVENAMEETFTLTSMLDRVSEDQLPWNYTIAAGKTTKEVLTDLFQKFNVSYSFADGCGSKKYNTAKVYEVGENVLSTLYDVANVASCTLNLNGHGTVIVEPYIAPSTKTPMFEFNDHNGTIDGPIQKTNSPFDAVNRVIVTAEEDEKKVIGYSDVDNSSSTSYNKLGRRKTETYYSDELSPFTNSQASLEAKSRMQSYEDDPAEYSFSGIYYPMDTGSVCTIGMDETYANAMLKTRTIELSPGMPCDYTFKEV